MMSGLSCGMDLIDETSWASKKRKRLIAVINAANAMVNYTVIRLNDIMWYSHSIFNMR